MVSVLQVKNFATLQLYFTNFAISLLNFFFWKSKALCNFASSFTVYKVQAVNSNSADTSKFPILVFPIFILLKNIKKQLTGRSFKKLEFQQTQKSLIPVLLFITLQKKQKISAKLIQFDLN